MLNNYNMYEKHPLDIALEHAVKGEVNTSEQILKKISDDPRATFNLAWHDLRHGNFYEGYEKLNAGRWLNVFGSPPLTTYAPIWSGPNPTIILRSEGGLGDHIINARFATQLSNYGRVILTTHPSLVKLLSNIEGVSECRSEREELPLHDVWIPAMSAPYVLKMEYRDLSGRPYLKANPKKLKGKFKVGLRWAGNPQFEHEQYRRFPIELMLDLAKISGATFYSLQRDNDLIDVPFTDLRHEMKTWEDTASILAGLDLVITSDTSIAHCAAALGIETWNILPILPYYLYALPQNTTPWYDTMKLYRQEEYTNWESPFINIKNDLINKLNNLKLL